MQRCVFLGLLSAVSANGPDAVQEMLLTGASRTTAAPSALCGKHLLIENTATTNKSVVIDGQVVQFLPGEKLCFRGTASSLWKVTDYPSCSVVRIKSILTEIEAVCSPSSGTESYTRNAALVNELSSFVQWLRKMDPATRTAYLQTTLSEAAVVAARIVASRCQSTVQPDVTCDHHAALLYWARIFLLYVDGDASRAFTDQWQQQLADRHRVIIADNNFFNSASL